MSSDPQQPRPDLQHVCTLHHVVSFRGSAWSPDGKLLAIGTRALTLSIRDARTGEEHRSWRVGQHPRSMIRELAWSPDGAFIATIQRDRCITLWNAQHGRKLAERIYANPGYGLTWSPNSRYLAWGETNGLVRVWNTMSNKVLVTNLHTSSPSAIAWSRDSTKLFSGGADAVLAEWAVGPRSIKVDDVISLTHPILAATLAPDGDTLAVALEGGMICILRTSARPRIKEELEGHTDEVCGLSFSHDGQLLASTSLDGTLRLWRCDTWQPITTLREPGTSGSGVQFHPGAPILAAHDSKGLNVLVWELDYAAFLLTQPEVPHYRNAKAVLVGDTGVGKSGLGLVLTNKPFAPTESTHGRRVWTLETQETALPNGVKEIRETLLWDLAGQPGYRLIHQLHLNEVALALVVFDSRSETDPFSGVRHWDRALRQAQRLEAATGRKLKKYLVAARADRGGIPVSRERIEAMVREFDFDGYFETSAKEGSQIPELQAMIRGAIDWDSLPKITSNDLFQSIKQFLIDEKKDGRLLSTADDLYRSFASSPPNTSDDDLRASFETCIGRVETQGLIRRLTFGNQVLLQPELLDAYASALIDTARSEPDGLGFIAEEDALAGRFKMPSDERIKDKGHEKLLLIAMVEELLRHELALKEVTEAGAELVFPSQFTRERPDAPELSGKSVVFTFEGALLNVYATLAVRLSHSQFFKKHEMWKNAATYTASVGGVCGIHLRELQEGQGELTLFFDASASEATRFQFEDYVAAHLTRRALPHSVQRRRTFSCPSCNEPVTHNQAKRRRELGHSSIRCNVCDTEFSLLDREERLSAPVSSAIAEMDRAADTQRDLDAATMTLRGKIASGDYDVFLSYNSADRQAVKQISEQLKQHGLRPWIDVEDLRPGVSWQKALDEQIKKVKAAAVFIGPQGLGPWQDKEQEALLTQLVRRDCAVFPVVLSTCGDALPELPSFLDTVHKVDFRSPEPDPLRQLIWGITGERDLYD